MKHILITTIAAVVLVGCGNPEADRALVVSIREGDMEAVQQALSDGADVNSKDMMGDNPLHAAAMNGQKEIAELLIAEGAEVNAKGKPGRTPLHWAAYDNHKETVVLLIGKGADVNAREKNGETPLHHAAAYGNSEISELLINKGADVNAMNNQNETSLDWSKQRETGKYKGVNGKEINEGIDKNILKKLNARKETNSTLLLKHGGKTGEEVLAEESILGAVNIGDIKLVEQHLAAGADVNAKDSVRWTPLHHAAFEGYKEVAELLIAKGADVNATADTGATPLGLAYGATADLLRKHGGKTAEELKAEGE